MSLRDRVDSEVRSQARSQAEVVAASAAELLDPTQHASLERLVKISAESVRGRVIVVNRRGRLLADSTGTPAGRSYASRPEVRAALQNGSSEQITRNSETLGTELLATAVPVLEHGRTGGAVRITQSVAAVNRAVRTSILNLAALGGVVLLLALAAGALIARQIALPIRRLDRAARQVAAGDLATTVRVEGSAEQRSLAQTFNEMTQRIRRLLRAQQDFVADASHQLRTPLTGLRLRLEVLGQRLGGDPTEEEVSAAMREIDRLSLIVEELLILSRAGEHELPGERVDLGDAARRAAERWQRTAQNRGIDLKARGEGGANGAWCAAPDLDRSIDALLENALRYSPSGSAVTVAAKPGRLEILDQGPGLEPGEVETVFERFSRGSAGRRGPSGTGLGLPIARELTRQWGGDVTLANRSEGGLRALIEVSE